MMLGATNTIDRILDREAGAATATPAAGPIATILTAYDASKSERLLGFLLNMGYDQLCLVTCDAWKLKCGGLPKNSFIIVKLNPEAAGLRQSTTGQYLILARVRETATTPVDKDIQNTIFQIHKVQAQIDPLTNLELQWGGLKADILGTYYDTDDGKIAFGNDTDSLLSPHFYEVYVPTDNHLEMLINYFVDILEEAQPIPIGRLRYTETETTGKVRNIEVRASPIDFVANRTALFGKTRMGKSNTIKIILDTLLSSVANLGQVVFDLSGEYTYPDPQTDVSLYLKFRERCIRYSLNPRHPEVERKAGVQPPSMLRSNFYKQIKLGHAIIRTLFDTVHSAKPPGYMAPFLGWEPVDEDEIEERFEDRGEQKRYIRALSMYRALLYEAGFRGGDSLNVPLMLHEPVRQRLAQNEDISHFAQLESSREGVVQIADLQSLPVAARIYTHLWAVYDSIPNDAKLFPASKRSGKPYFEKIHESMLEMIGNRNILGPRYLTPFKDYHDPKGANVQRAIVNDVEDGKTVLIDLANADQVIAGYYSEMIARAVFARQMEKFSTMERIEFEKSSVLFYFEEAHNLFRADDRDLTSIYNKLAKEGAKFRIGMVYATQSMTTLSPDLLKNTENFFIAHLNDDREIRELERRYEFNGIGLDVQRARSKGYVRMITLSHRFALPVQIKLFTSTAESVQTHGPGRAPAARTLSLFGEPA